MSDFKVLVRKIDQPVINHPNADRLTVVQIGGYQAVANKFADGSFRYNEGDYIVYVPEAAVVPEWALKHFGYWDDEANKGMLAGSKGDRVKAIKLRSLVSQGLIFPVVNYDGDLALRLPVIDETTGEWIGRKTVIVAEGQDVAELLGIQKYDPPIPASMSGDVANLQGKTRKYDFENHKSVPDIFDVGEEVVATEKLHGTFCVIAYHPNLAHPEMFFGGDILVGSKGLSAQGLVFKDSDSNGNLYVRNLRAMLTTGFGDRLKALSNIAVGVHLPVYVYGEIFGRGVQDLHYGLGAPEFRVFDIVVGDSFLGYDEFVKAAIRLEVETVPLIYRGPFDAEFLKGHREGKTTFGGGANIREGIVVKTEIETRHPFYGRKIAKMVSDAYLLRKNKDGTAPTEFN